jgi:hypothetical protein
MDKRAMRKIHVIPIQILNVAMRGKFIFSSSDGEGWREGLETGFNFIGRNIFLIQNLVQSF